MHCKNKLLRLPFQRYIQTICAIAAHLFYTLALTSHADETSALAIDALKASNEIAYELKPLDRIDSVTLVRTWESKFEKGWSPIKEERVRLALVLAKWYVRAEQLDAATRWLNRAIQINGKEPRSLVVATNAIEILIESAKIEIALANGETSKAITTANAILADDQQALLPFSTYSRILLPFGLRGKNRENNLLPSMEKMQLCFERNQKAFQSKIISNEEFAENTIHYSIISANFDSALIATQQAINALPDINSLQIHNYDLRFHRSRLYRAIADALPKRDGEESTRDTQIFMKAIDYQIDLLCFLKSHPDVLRKRPLATFIAYRELSELEWYKLRRHEEAMIWIGRAIEACERPRPITSMDLALSLEAKCGILAFGRTIVREQLRREKSYTWPRQLFQFVSRDRLIEDSQKALFAYRNRLHENDPRRIRALLLLAIGEMENESYSDAIEHLLIALQICKKQNKVDDYVLGRLNLLIAECRFKKSGETNSTLESFDSAIRSADKVDDIETKTRSKLGIGHVNQVEGNFSIAIGMFESIVSSDLSEELDETRKAKILRILTLKDQGDQQKAGDEIEAMIGDFKNSKSTSDIYVLLQLVQCEIALSKYNPSDSRRFLQQVDPNSLTFEKYPRLRTEYQHQLALTSLLHKEYLSAIKSWEGILNDLSIDHLIEARTRYFLSIGLQRGESDSIFGARAQLLEEKKSYREKIQAYESKRQKVNSNSDVQNLEYEFKKLNQLHDSLIARERKSLMTFHESYHNHLLRLNSEIAKAYQAISKIPSLSPNLHYAICCQYAHNLQLLEDNNILPLDNLVSGKSIATLLDEANGLSNRIVSQFGMERQSEILSSYRWSYDQTIARLVQSGKILEAMVVCEETRNRSFVTLVNSLFDVEKSGVTELSKARNHLYSMRGNLLKLELNDKSNSNEIVLKKAKLLESIELAEKELTVLEQRFARINFGNESSEHRNKICSKLLELSSEGNMILAYYIGQHETYVFCLPPNSVEPFVKVQNYGAVSIGSRVQEAWQTFSTRPPGLQTDSESLLQLAEILFPEEAREVAAQVAAKTGSLIILPHGSLYILPLEALPVRSTDLPLTKKQYLFDVLPPTIYSPSLMLSHSQGQREEVPSNDRLNTVLTLQPYDQTTRESSDVVGDESIHIADIFHPNSKRFAGTNATKDVILEQGEKFQIIHIATHGGRFNNNSYLEVYGPNGKISMLKDFDVRSIKLNSKLVALSACETKQIDIDDTRFGGDTQSAMTSAFLIAGATNTIGSHWKVDNSSTRDLFQVIFKKIHDSSSYSSPYELAKFLHHARLNIRNSSKDGFDHPFHWAPFTLDSYLD